MTDTVQAERTVLHLDAGGVQRRSELGVVPRGPEIENLISGGALWVQSSAAWVGKAVAVGLHGSQVFSEFEFGVDHAELMSGFDQNPPVPVWTNDVPLTAAFTMVDSAETADVHVSMHQLVINNNNSTKQSVVTKYSSGASAPDWAYTFPTITGGAARVGVSSDGARIVAVSLNNLNMKLQVAIFESNSGTPQWSGEFTFGLQLRGFDLSADGNWLYLSTQTTAYVWNVNTHALQAMVLLPGGFECHAISGDGSVFAYGYFNGLDVYERNSSGAYTKTYTRTLAGSCVCGKIDISADSSTIVYGFNYWDTNLKVRVEALDVASKQVTMFDEAIGTGSYQNVVGDIAVCDNGSRFAIGLWGDEGNVCPEVRMYKKNQNAPAQTDNLTGSVFDVDISGDGERVVVGSKAGHANTFAGGGSVALYAFEPLDFRLVGTPSLGQSVLFQASGSPNSGVKLLRAGSAANNSHTFPGVGTLHLPRNLITAMDMPNSDANGNTADTFSLPANASQIGATYCFQGLYLSPRRLTNDWVQMTILP